MLKLIASCLLASALVMASLAVLAFAFVNAAQAQDHRHTAAAVLACQD